MKPHSTVCAKFFFCPTIDKQNALIVKWNENSFYFQQIDGIDVEEIKQTQGEYKKKKKEKQHKT